MKRLARWFGAGRQPDGLAGPHGDAIPALPVALDDAAYLADPHPVDDWLRRNNPVAPVAGGGYVLTRHADVMAAFVDARLGNAPSRFSVLHPRHAGRHLAAEMASRMPPFLDMPAQRLPRQALVRAYHGCLTGFASSLTDLASHVVSQLPRGQTFDLISAAAEPMACRSIAAFVGLQTPPFTLRPATGALFQMFAPITDAAAFAQGAKRLAVMRDHLAQALALRRTVPGADLLSHLLAFQADHPDLTDDHIIDGAFLVLADGVENIIAGSALALRSILAAPGAGEALTAGAPPEVMVSEALRLHTPALTVPRIAREDLTLHGARIAHARLHQCQNQRANLGRHRCIGERLGLAQIGALVLALVQAGVRDAGAPFAYHQRFGHRWPVQMPVTLS